MSSRSTSRVFHFFPLEDRVLLDGDASDFQDSAAEPGTEVLSNLLDQLAAGETIVEHAANSVTASDRNLESESAIDGEATNAPVSNRVEVIFVDEGLQDVESLLGELQSGRDQPVEFLIHRLSSDQDGIEQISEHLDSISHVDAIHLLTHGSETGFQIGSAWLTEENLDGYAGQIARWRDSLSEGSDLMIYGCNLASDPAGITLLDSLAALCDCDVAASDDSTGHAMLGGDWDLEYRIGDVQTGVPFTAAGQAGWFATLDPPTDLIITQTVGGGLAINQSGNNTLFASASGLASNLDQFTYEVRFAADAFSGEQVFLSYNVGNEDQLSFQLDDNGNRLELDIGAGSQIYSNAIDYQAALVDGAEHTLSVTWENTLGSWQVFIDGEMVDSGTGFQVGRQVLSAGTFVFGQEQDRQGSRYDSFQHFKGTLYEARLFEDVRSVAEIAGNYSVSVPNSEDSLIANWQFDHLDSSGTITESVSGLTLTRGVATGAGFTIDDSGLSLTVSESDADGTTIGQVQALDSSQNSITTTFQILTQSVDGTFVIDPNSGEITIADASLIDQDTLAIHNLVIRVTDSSGNAYDQPVTVNLVAGNSEQALDLNLPLSVDEGDSVVLGESVLLTTDSEQSPSELRYIVTSEVSHGQLTLAGTEIVSGQSFTQQDLRDGLVRYEQGGSEVTGDQFDFVVDDGFGAVTQATFHLSVNLVDDPVVLVAPNLVNTAEDVPLSFGASGAGVIEASDEEGGVIKLHLSVDEGSLILGTTTGLSFTDADGSDGTLLFAGLQSEISAALSTLSYTPDAGFNGNTTLVITATDGNSVSSVSVDIVITPVPSVLIWDGGGATDDWSDPLNWDLDRIPRGDDTVVFNATSHSDSLIDVAFAGEITNIQIDAGYSGVVQQATDLTVANSIQLADGRFVSAGHSLEVLHDWTATAGLADISSSELLVGGDFDQQAALLSDNSTVTLNGDGDQAFSSTQELNHLRIDKTGGVALLTDTLIIRGNLAVDDGNVDATALELILTTGFAATVDAQIGPIGSLEIDASSTKLIDGTLEVNGQTQFTQLALLNGGTIRALGDVNAIDNAYSGTTILELGGHRDQNISTAGGVGMIRNLVIDKDGGTATAIEDLELAGQVKHVAGLLDTSGVTTRFVSINLEIETGPLAFGDVQFDHFASANITGDLVVDGDLDFRQVFKVDGGVISVTGDVTSSDATVLGTAGIRLTGANNQTLSGSDVTDGDLLIDKDAGTVFLNDDLILNGTSQNLNVVRGELALNGNEVRTDGTVSVAGGWITGTGIVTGDLLVGSTGTVRLDASNTEPVGHDQLQVGGNLHLDSGATILLDVAAISDGGLIADLVTFTSRSGATPDATLIGNAAGFIPHVEIDDVGNTIGVFLNTAPTGSLPDITLIEDSADRTIHLPPFFSDEEHASADFEFSVVGNDNPSLFDSVAIDDHAKTLTISLAMNQNGSAIVTVRVTDPRGDSLDVSFTVSVNAEDDAPDFTVGTLNTNEGDSQAITASHLFSTDPDTDTDQLVYSVTRSPLHGDILVDGVVSSTFTQDQIDGGRVAYRHDGSEQFSDDFLVELSDGTSVSSERAVSINIAPVSDHAPTITSDGGGDTANLAIDENTTAVTKVLAFDADLPSETLSYQIAGGIDSASFQIDAAGNLRFILRPDAENHVDANGDGIYVVQVSVTDGTFIDTQTIHVTVTDVDEFDVQGIVDVNLIDNQFAVSQGLGAAVGVTVSAIDADLSNSAITYSLTDDDGGRFVIDSNSGEISTNGTFLQGDDGTTRLLTVRAESEDGSSIEQTFAIEVLYDESAPTAANDSFTTNAGQPLRIAGRSVLDNDVDLDGDALSAALVVGPQHGAVVMSADGRFTYVPDAGFVGSDQFQYAVDDGNGHSSIAQVQIQVVVGGAATTGSSNGINASAGLSVENMPGNRGDAPGADGVGSEMAGGPVEPVGDSMYGSNFGAPDSIVSASNSGPENQGDSQPDGSSDQSATSEADLVEVGVDSASGSTTADHSQSVKTGSVQPANDIASEEAEVLQMVFESLFASTAEQELEVAESSDEMRQLERILKMDLRQAILWDMWDNNDNLLDDSPTRMFIGTAGAAAGLFSFGYVMWALRGGAFMSVIASSIPSWRLIDPTAILTAYRSTSESAKECLTEIVGRK